VVRILRIITYPLLVILLYAGIKELIPILAWTIKHLNIYMWMFIGFIVFIGLTFIPLYRKNSGLLETLSHELSHAAIGILFFRQIHSLNATGHQGGMITHSGARFGDLFISLAPYCLPLFTIPFLLLRPLSTRVGLPWFDFIIGFTLAFHVVCFLKQTSPHQPDLRNHGLPLSFLFIISFLIMNLEIIFMSIRLNVFKGTATLFSNYWNEISRLFTVLFT
jgi:hypothetical protein